MGHVGHFWFCSVLFTSNILGWLFIVPDQLGTIARDVVLEYPPPIETERALAAAVAEIEQAIEKALAESERGEKQPAETKEELKGWRSATNRALGE